MFRKLCTFVVLTLAALISVNAYASISTQPLHHHRLTTVQAPSFQGVKSTVIASVPRHRTFHHAVVHRHANRVYTAAASHPTVHDEPVLSEASRTEECMAQAIYREAKSESPQGQAAVGYVVMNRTQARGYPGSVCGVVYQQSRNSAGVARCQFSWVCHTPAGRINTAQMAYAHRVAQGVLDHSLPNPIGDALYFHESCFALRPSRHAPYHLVLGHHIFYSPTPMHAHPPTELALNEHPSPT
jgi:spore germination cell wall hydrolase CwlJ-like protein